MRKLIDWIRRVFKSDCNHEWCAWGDPVGSAYKLQYRSCKKCNFAEFRSVKYVSGLEFISIRHSDEGLKCEH
jgi:hypothetical protein